MKIESRGPPTTGVATGAPPASSPRSSPGAVATEPLVPPLPSGAQLAQRSAALADVPITTPFGARLAALGASDRSGVIALAQRLDEIAQLCASGQTVRCVFDLDNTLFDTRFRTLHAAKEFDRLNGSHWFDGLSEATIDQVGFDGRATAAAAGLPPAVVEAFAGFWKRSFWTPANLAHDRPIAASFELLRAAQQAGAKISFLTGRAESWHDPNSGAPTGFRADTRAQLERAGIDLADCELVLKPRPQDSTPHFKEALLRGWQAQGPIGFFVTEGKIDLAHIAPRLPEAHCFMLGCSIEPDLAVVPPYVPRLPPVF